MIYYTRYVCSQNKKGKKYLIFDGYMLDKVLDKITKITDIKKCDNTKTLIDTHDKLRYCNINNISYKRRW